MENRQVFGPCVLQDGRTGKEERWILRIPQALVRELKMGEDDSCEQDTVRRLFKNLHGGAMPMWCTQGEESFLIEFPPGTTDETLEKFVALLLENKW